MLEPEVTALHVRLAGALGTRVGSDDPEALAQLRTIVGLYRDAEARAAGILHGDTLADGTRNSALVYSWAEIAQAQGITRQAAAKRYGIPGHEAR